MSFKKTFLIISTIFITFPGLALAADIPSFFGFDTSSPQAWVNSIYRYGLSLGAILALAGLVYGGFRYLTSAGNEEAVTSGKQAIFAALSGLVIMLLSHMILTTIDPRLVELRLTMPEVDLPEARCESDGACGDGRVCRDGVCISRAACENDRDCPSGQTCIVYTDGHGVCEAPRSSTACNPDAPNQDREVCEGRLGAGSRCVDTHPPVCSDPQSGQNGRGCINNTSCNTGLTCISGAGGRKLCTDRQVSSPCNAASDCNSRVCNNNICAEASGISGRANGTECSNNNDCQSDVCATGRSPHICVAGDGRSEDGACASDNDCLSSYYCNTQARGGATYWRCQADLNNGATCYGDTWCTSGYCSGWNRFGGTCANRE